MPVLADHRGAPGRAGLMSRQAEARLLVSGGGRGTGVPAVGRRSPAGRVRRGRARRAAVSLPAAPFSPARWSTAKVGRRNRRFPRSPVVGGLPATAV